MSVSPGTGLCSRCLRASLMVVWAARDDRDICATEEAELHRLESGPGGVAQAEEGDGSGASATADPAAGSHREGGQGSAEAAAAASDSSRSGMTVDRGSRCRLYFSVSKLPGSVSICFCIFLYPKQPGYRLYFAVSGGRISVSTI